MRLPFIYIIFLLLLLPGFFAAPISFTPSTHLSRALKEVGEPKHLTNLALGDKIGSGQFGTVYGLADPKHVAKQFQVEADEAKVKKEAQVLKTLDQFVEWGYTLAADGKKQYYIIMQRINGKPLDKTALFKAADTETRHQLMQEVAGKAAVKVAAIFSANLVQHCDTHMGNILVEDDGKKVTDVELIDWGSAKILKGDAPQKTVKCLTKWIAACMAAMYGKGAKSS